ncbi:hypothetical protein ACRAKI_27315 [Saccharothrix isguenensis]
MPREVNPEFRVEVTPDAVRRGSTRAFVEFTLPCVTALAGKGSGPATSAPDHVPDHVPAYAPDHVSDQR